jgi:hypothetical protein
MGGCCALPTSNDTDATHLKISVPTRSDRDGDLRDGWCSVEALYEGFANRTRAVIHASDEDVHAALQALKVRMLNAWIRRSPVGRYPVLRVNGHSRVEVKS